MTSLQITIESYLIDLGTENMRPRYISFQRTRLGYFLTFVTDKNPSYKVKDLSRADVQEYMVSLQTRQVKFAKHPKHKQKEGKLSPGYIHGCIRSIKAFATWLYEEGYSQTNVLQGFKLPKIPKRQPVPLDEEEIKKVLDATQKTLESERNYAIFCLMFDTGMRVEEVSLLRDAQIFFQKAKSSSLAKAISSARSRSLEKSAEPCCAIRLTGQRLLSPRKVSFS